jgi:transglutaminase-like putative cysteine protease
MRISISHVSEYTYEGPSAPSVQALRLHPAPVHGQTVLSWTIEAPGFAQAATYTDGFGNRVDLVATPADLTTVRVAAFGEIETTDTGGVAGATGESLATEAYLRTNATTDASAEIVAMAEAARDPDRLATLHQLMAAIGAHMTYDPDSTHAQTTAAAAFAAKRGVCQDYAHIFISAARHLEIPARYVTGYLLLEDGSGSSAHHAWAESSVDHIGWVGFDATNDLCPTDRYVRLGSALDAASAAPIRGVRRQVGQETLRVEVGVREAGHSGAGHSGAGHSGAGQNGVEQNQSQTQQ